MNKISNWFLGAMLIVSGCSDRPLALQTDSTEDHSVRVGADTQSGTCNISAGYTYSDVKKRCIRFWEDGFRFKRYRVDTAMGWEESVFVVLSDDQSQAEIFWGGTDRPSIIERFSGDYSGGLRTLYRNDVEKLKIDCSGDTCWVIDMNRKEPVCYQPNRNNDKSLEAALK